VFSRFGRLLLILALLSATGTHWVMLQSVAWAAMLADNARTDSFPTAIEKTFDGKHPCSLCKQIAKGRHSQNKSDQQNDVKRLEFFNQLVVFIINPPDHFILCGENSTSLPELIHAPPVPPPRSIAA
jgi:hypothetical protein